MNDFDFELRRIANTYEQTLIQCKKLKIDRNEAKTISREDLYKKHPLILEYREKSPNGEWFQIVSKMGLIIQKIYPICVKKRISKSNSIANGNEATSYFVIRGFPNIKRKVKQISEIENISQADVIANLVEEALINRESNKGKKDEIMVHNKIGKNINNPIMQLFRDAADSGFIPFEKYIKVFDYAELIQSKSYSKYNAYINLLKKEGYSLEETEFGYKVNQKEAALRKFRSDLIEMKEKINISIDKGEFDQKFEVLIRNYKTCQINIDKLEKEIYGGN